MLKKDEYLKTVKRPYPPLFCSIVCTGYANPENFVGILHEPFSIMDMVHADTNWYYGKEGLEQGGLIAMREWKDPKIFSAIKTEFNKREDDLISSSVKGFESFCSAYEKYMPLLILIFAIEKPVENALKEALLRKISITRVEELMNKLNIPLQNNYYKQEEYDLVTKTNLIEHVAKYRWLNARYGQEHEYTVAEAQSKLDGMDRENFLEEYSSQKEDLKKVLIEAKAILQEDAYLVDMFQYIIFYRTHRTDTMNKAAFLAIPILKLKADSLNLTYSQLLLCSEEEAISKNIPKPEILDEREKDCTTILESGKIRCVSGEESKKIIQALADTVENVHEFKGNIACKGKVRGVVKLVASKNDFIKVKLGDVLVTSMTTPEMVPIMKNAVAFITDEGGVTCHAAIISREMKKPCIIGTKIATKVLKDGDMVEVDAEKGIVKIIK